MKRVFIFFTILISIFISIPSFSKAVFAYDFVDSNFESNKTCLHLFYKDDCSQCMKVVEHLSEVEQKYNVSIHRYNINITENNNLFGEFKKRYGLAEGAYPMIFIGNRYLIGEKAILNYLESEVGVCEEGCACPLRDIKGETPYLPQSSEVVPETNNSIKIPYFGEINFSSMSILATTAIIAFVDGFNPCSLWLISFLLGIVIYSGSKRKIFMVGMTFLLVTGGAYAFFMAGLLNVFLYIGYITWIQITVALFALVFALVNIKDYFWYKKGLSFTISDKYKPKIFKDMRSLLKGDKSTKTMVLGTAVMALGVVLVELPCTAGFPVVWTNIIAQNSIHGASYYFYLFLYMIIYLMDEILILIIATLTMKISRFEEKHGRVLKLIGGVIMLSLALVMLFNPEIMNNIKGSLLIFLSAGILSAMIIIIHRYILPRFGILIGSEKSLIKNENNKDEQ